MADQTSTRPSPGEQAVNALKLVADLGFLPGSGQLAEGKVREGLLFGVTGLATKMLLSPILGPLGWVPWIAVGLDSFSKGASGKHLWQLKPGSDAPPPVAEPADGAP